MNRKASCSDLYRDTLPADVRKRYNEKTSVIQVDPYELPDAEFTIDHHKWPLLSYVDMLDFVIFKQSYYTREQLRNVKSLDAQELVQDGWIREIRHKEIHGNHPLRAKVLITYDCCCFSLSSLLLTVSETSILDTPSPHPFPLSTSTINVLGSTGAYSLRLSLHLHVLIGPGTCNVCLWQFYGPVNPVGS